MQIQAIEALRRHEEKLFGKVKAKELPPEEQRQGRWLRPRIKMRLSTDQLSKEFEEERKIERIEQIGELIDRDHSRFTEEARARQAAHNGNIKKSI